MVVICGSAISAVTQPRLPSTIDITGAVCASIEGRLDQGDYLDRSTAEYAASLATGAHSDLRLQTKLEEFLERLQAQVGAEDTGRLMQGLFYCEPLHYGLNHCVIAHLVESGAAEGVITTNFDNALERASPALQHNKFSYPNVPPSSMRHPYLVKVHGDVETGQYINTHSGMITALAEAYHSYILELLDGRTVIVAGYSGTGDIDVFPWLQRANAKLLWLSRRPDQVPPGARYFPCDLSSHEAQTNLLIALAEEHGWEGTSHSGRDHPWRNNVTHFFASVEPIKLMRVVQSIFYGKSEWPMLHMHRVIRWCRPAIFPDRSEREWDHARTCLGIPLYTSAMRSFQRVTRPPEREAARVRWIGFTHWRRGELSPALDLLRAFAGDRFDHLPSELAEGLRQYLETATDFLNTLPTRKRREAYAAYGLQEATEKLRNLHQIHPRGRIYSHLILLTIAMAMDDAPPPPLLAKELRAIYQQFYDLQMYAEAGSAARTLASTDRRESMQLLGTLLPILKKERCWPSFQRCKWWLKMLSIGIPINLTQWLLEGRLRRVIQIPLYEIRYRLRLVRWWVAWRLKRPFIT